MFFVFASLVGYVVGSLLGDMLASVLVLILLAMVLVLRIQAFAEMRDRRQVASPYGMLRAPSDTRLRSTRKVHFPICECEVPDQIKGTHFCYKCGNDLSLRTIVEKEGENGDERDNSPETD